MLSYRHAFHAGNHADILKHATQTFILQSLLRKEKPFIYIDTHAGAGLYDLKGDWAQKTGEAQLGIQHLWQQREQFPELTEYFTALQAKDNAQLRYYLGSPLISEYFLRQQDRMALMELHPKDADEIKRRLRKPKQTRFFQTDGFKQLIALVPPKPSRGFVLIDPPYEVKSDYLKVADTLQQAHKRWATGIFAIWYPILSQGKDMSRTMLKKIQQQGHKNTLVVEMSVENPQNSMGMHGSGMVVINAPWQLDTCMENLLPRLAQTLSQDSHSSTRIEWITPQV